MVPTCALLGALAAFMVGYGWRLTEEPSADVQAVFTGWLASEDGYKFGDGNYQRILVMTDLEPDDLLFFKLVAQRFRAFLQQKNSQMLFVVGEGGPKSAKVEYMAHVLCAYGILTEETRQIITIVQGAYGEESLWQKHDGLGEFYGHCPASLAYRHGPYGYDLAELEASMTRFLLASDAVYAIVIKPPRELVGSKSLRVMIRHTVAAIYGSFNLNYDSGDARAAVSRFKSAFVVERKKLVDPYSLGQSSTPRFWSTVVGNDAGFKNTTRYWNVWTLRDFLFDQIPDRLQAFIKANASDAGAAELQRDVDSLVRAVHEKLDAGHDIFEDAEIKDAIAALRNDMAINEVDSIIAKMPPPVPLQVSYMLEVLAQMMAEHGEQTCFADPLVAAFILDTSPEPSLPSMPMLAMGMNPNSLGASPLVTPVSSSKRQTFAAALQILHATAA